VRERISVCEILSVARIARTTADHARIIRVLSRFADASVTAFIAPNILRFSASITRIDHVASFPLSRYITYNRITNNLNNFRE